MSEKIPATQWDVVIIGAGPAGLQAALHAARKKARVLVLGRPEKSSLYNAHIENYLCVEGVRLGSELLSIGVAQARKFGAEIMAQDVLGVEEMGGMFHIHCESGAHLATHALIYATGTSRKLLKVKGEKELSGRGVSYCVDCDINFFRNVPVVVVGNGSAAVDGALTLERSASKVHLVAKKLDVTETLMQRLHDSGVIVHQDTWPEEIAGDTAVTGLVLDNGDTIAVEGVFIELGSKGAMELALGIGVQLDPEDFTHIVVDKRQQTNIEGVFAAGDITGHPYQMALAVGEGCVAGMEAVAYARKKSREKNS